MTSERLRAMATTTSCLLALLAILSVSLAAPQSDNGGDQLVKPDVGAQTPAANQQDKPRRPEQVTVIAPKFLRPNSDYHVLVQLANSNTPATVDLQLVGARDSDREQTEAKSVLAHPNETQTVKFQVGDWPAAEYLLAVNVVAVDKSWQFKDEKSLTYQAKSFSGFIQTDKAIYKPGQQVQFRVLFLTQNLTPFVMNQNEINVTVEDPARNLIKQWPALSNYRGLLSLELPLSDEPMLGDYAIKVSARGQQFGKQFTVAEYVLPTYGVSVQLPAYATYNESNIVATVRAVYTYGKPVRGHVTLSVQPLVRFSSISTQPLEQAQFRARLEPDGSADFRLDLVRELRLREDRFEREIEFFALVEEDLTGRKYNDTKTLLIHDNKIKIERVKDASLKLGLPTLMRYKVAYQDGLPVENNGPKVELKYSLLYLPFKTFELTPVNGIVEHQLEVPQRVGDPRILSYDAVPNNVEVEVNYRDHRHYLDPIPVQFTHSNQYLQIQLPQLQKLRLQRQAAAAAARRTSARNEIAVNDELQIQLRTTEPIQQVDVTCQGFARGDIVWALSKRVPAAEGKNVTELEFKVKVEPRMVPQMGVLCFYVRAEDKELIADFVQVDVVDRSLRNLAKITTSRDEAKPGQEVEVSVLTKPNSLVGVLGIDQSTLLLKSGNDLDSKAIMNDLKSYGQSEPSSLERRSNTADLLEGSDVVVMTNNLVYDGYGPGRLFRKFGSPYLYQRAYVSQQAPANIALSPLILESAVQPNEFHLKPRQADEPIRIRTEFPETWIWRNATADSSGQVRFSAKVPDTITSWQLSAFSMNEAHGLALNSGKSSIRVFRPFFIKLNLPYSIIRGEIVNIQAIVFNYSKRPMRARVTLDNARNEFELVEAANSIGDEKSLGPESSTRSVQVPAEDGASVSFLVKPTKLGHIDIRVLARADLASDGVVRKLLVKAEGQTQHFNRAMLVQLKRQAADGQAQVWRQNVTLSVPANAVPDSQRVSVSAIGDILGAGLANPDDLLRLPYGCGEQNMINLVPNIVIYNYLKNTNRLRDLQRDRARRNIQVGYQRELNYKRSDGSFSAFGQSDANGSVWLTAYVLKSLQQARRIISVDEKVLREAVQFLARHSLADGSVEEFGMLHHKDLASKSLGDGKSKGIYLTAYVMTALMQEPISGGAERELLDKGLDFLGRQLADGGGDQLSTYELSIIAHALQLSTWAAGDKWQGAAERAYELLWSRAIERPDDNQVHWSNAAAKSTPPPIVDEIDAAEVGPAGPDREAKQSAGQADKQRHSNSPRSLARQQQQAPPLKEFAVKSDQSAHLFVPDSLDVEMTSWALLTAVRRNELERSLPVVRWLVAKQNSLGGFASTQDTVLAVEALANYAEASVNSLAANSSLPAQSVEIEFVYPRAQTGSSALRKHGLDQVLVSRANSLVHQQTRLPDNITWVQVQANGVGLAVVQVSWQYNLMVSAERPAFYLAPTLDSQSDANYLKLSVCTYYKAGDPDDRQAASNMAVAEVELPSGYAADMEALRANARHPLIKRVDTAEADTKVLVYLDRVTRDELCFTVPAHRSSKVSNNKPVPVSIYDYYKRDQAARVFYKPQPASSCDICEQESCSESCSSGPADPADRLPSLHEQRARQQQQQQQQSADTQTSGRLIEARNSTARNATDIDAYKLLPLTSAFSAINQATKNTSLNF